MVPATSVNYAAFKVEVSFPHWTANWDAGTTAIIGVNDCAYALNTINVVLKAA